MGGGVLLFFLFFLDGGEGTVTDKSQEVNE